MAYRLYDFPASPFCIKVRRVLDYKGLTYERMNVAGPRILELRARGEVGKVPALDMDGTLVADSTDIVYALDAAHPEPPVLPTDPVQRAHCHVLEDWADESLYWPALYYLWQDDAGYARTVRVFKGPARLATPLMRRSAMAQLRGQGTGRKTRQHVDADVGRHLQHIDALLDGTPFLLGDAPMLCDFALAGQLQYLASSPAGGDALSRHPALAAFTERLDTISRANRAR